METLSSLGETREFVNAHPGVLGVRTVVREADGVPAAAEMGRLLRACVRGLGWQVDYLVRLEEAGDLERSVSSARRSLDKLVAKLGKELVCAVAEEDGDARAAGRGRHGARPQRDGAGGRPRRRRDRTLDDRVTQVGVAFADGSGAATTTSDINALRDAEGDMRNTKSVDVEVRAAALSLQMKAVRLLLRRFAGDMASLEKRWATSGRRRYRASTSRPFREDFDKLQERRKELVPGLRGLDLQLRAFASETIEFL